MMPSPDSAEEDARHQQVRDAATQLSMPATDAQIQVLLRFVDLLKRWNGTYNLTAVRAGDDMLVQHLYDCMAVIPALLRAVGDGGGRILDVGSGAGLPGLVIAVFRPDLEVTCVDAVGKKAAFVQQCSFELGLKNLRVVHSRVENLRIEPVDMVTSRAFASLKDFVRLSSGCLKEAGLWVAMKGKFPAVEAEELPKEVELFHVEQLCVPHQTADRCLIWMRRRVH